MDSVSIRLRPWLPSPCLVTLSKNLDLSGPQVVTPPPQRCGEGYGTGSEMREWTGLFSWQASCRLSLVLNPGAGGQRGAGAEGKSSGAEASSGWPWPSLLTPSSFLKGIFLKGDCQGA